MSHGLLDGCCWAGSDATLARLPVLVCASRPALPCCDVRTFAVFSACVNQGPCVNVNTTDATTGATALLPCVNQLVNPFFHTNSRVDAHLPERNPLRNSFSRKLRTAQVCGVGGPTREKGAGGGCQFWGGNQPPLTVDVDLDKEIGCRHFVIHCE